ncbi:MAG: aspartate aminotransferase family protein [Deltaproteobacteria bacterium]|nr:MAG: aspartate aminotransferase family protein [Deltaproteobacteria bacterium]
MDIPEVGRARDAVLADLMAHKRGDFDTRGGGALAFVFHPDDDAAAVAERAYQAFLWDNALDPTVVRSALALETEIVAMAAHHLGGDGDVTGNFTSGGTESVLLAVKTARDWARAERGIERPQMVLPATAHPCFFKAAHYFDVEAVVTPVDPRTCRADVAAMAAAIGHRTALVVASAPGYAHGAVDPIPDIAALARDRGLLLHVDACIGGFLLPFFRELGRDVTPFDFSVPGVTSISMDFHKYALCPKGASVVLYRTPELRRYQIFTHSAWPGYAVINPTILSSKSCGPMAATWAMLHYLGRAGYRAIARRLAAMADRFAAGIGAIDGLTIVGRPEMTLFAVASKTHSVFRLCDEMKRRGWLMHPQLSTDTLPATFHVNLTPAVESRLDAWLADLADACAAAPDAGDDALSAVRAALSAVDFAKLDDRGIEQLLAMAGLGGGRAPSDRLGQVWELLDPLPSDVRNRVLTLYYNQLNRYRPPA